MLLDPAVFAKAMKEARENLGMTQNEVAEAIGVSPRSYQGYERGETPPPAKRVWSIAEALGIGLHTNRDGSISATPPDGFSEDLHERSFGKQLPGLSRAEDGTIANGPATRVKAPASGSGKTDFALLQTDSGSDLEEANGRSGKMASGGSAGVTAGPNAEGLATNSEDEVSRKHSGTLIAIPTVAAGHGASWSGRENTAEPEQAFIPEPYLALMLGGRVPRYENGRPRLLLSFAVGDSMAPHLPDGHPILIEPDAEFVDGGRYALWLGDADQDVVKRIVVGSRGRITLLADNSAIPSKVVTPTEDPHEFTAEDGEPIRIVVRGRVLWPADTSQAVFGQLAEFARSLIR